MASALEELRTSQQFTGGVYGSLRSLRTLLSMPDVPIDRVYAFFDHGVPTRRLCLLPGYKQARKERREMLTEEERERAFLQIDQCFELFGLLGVRCLAFKNREADDCVAAAVRVLATEEHRPVVVSSDADLLQTVALGADVWDQGHARWVTPPTFIETTGVHPGTFVVYRALVGDTSDSIEGARGCGPVRAVELIADLCAGQADQLPPPFQELTPLEQLAEIGLYLCGQPKLKAWQQAVLDALPRLRRVVMGIDLSDSFGGLTGLQGLMDVLPPVQDRPFLQACSRLGMKSVLGEPEAYLRPFRSVQARRLGKNSASTV